MRRKEDETLEKFREEEEEFRVGSEALIPYKNM